MSPFSFSCDTVVTSVYQGLDMAWGGEACSNLTPHLFSVGLWPSLLS